MRNLNNFLCAFISITLVIVACKGKKSELVSDTEILHNNQQQLTEVIIYDVFTPPVASRIYSYSSLASYEAIRFMKPGNASITAKLNGFKKMPEPEKGKKYNFTLAATKAFFTVVHKVVFSIDSLKSYEDGVYGQFKSNLDEDTYNRSIAFGDSVGKVVLARAATDNYKQTRGMPKFLGGNEPGKWRPTPPDYFDGVEAYWGKIKPFVLDSTNLQNRPVPDFPKFSDKPQSEYFKYVNEVYNIKNNLTPEQEEIARYWDDNPFIVEHHGHTSFATKKITPGGHWMGITAIACRKTKADALTTAKAYALTAVAMYDGFICCWSMKYKINTIRPVTVINEHLNPQWQPLLQTPPFPEYPSGHSTITRAAATVLTRLFGDNFAFQDTSDLKYIGMKRNFKSFVQAADEASISRVYGGIHYRFSVDDGAKDGKVVGDSVLKRLSF